MVQGLLVWHTGIDDCELGTVFRWGWFEGSVKLALTQSSSLWRFGATPEEKKQNEPSFQIQLSIFLPSLPLLICFPGRPVSQRTNGSSYPFARLPPAPVGLLPVTGLGEAQETFGNKGVLTNWQCLEVYPGAIAPQHWCWPWPKQCKRSFVSGTPGHTAGCWSWLSWLKEKYEKSNTTAKLPSENCALLELK